MNDAVSQIEIRTNRSGQTRAFVAGTQVRVLDIYAHAELQGESPDEIAGAFPHLTMGQIHAALAWYFDHRDQIVGELREEGELAEQFRRVIGPGPRAYER
jgi:uncharacterized protein (DUF433 family)